MSGIIKTLKNKINDIEKNVYPKTVLEAVVDPDTGKTLDVLLDNIDVDIPEGTTYIDFNEAGTDVPGEIEKVTSATTVSYNNATSGLNATNVQEAVDKTNEKIDNLVVSGGSVLYNLEQTETAINLKGSDNSISTVNIDSEISAVSANPVQNKAVAAKFEEVFQSVSNGKEMIASAITDKGVYTENDATFETMATNISQLKTGGNNFNIYYGDTAPEDKSKLWINHDAPSSYLITNKVTTSEAFDTDYDTVFPESRYGMGMATVGKKIYMFGGYSNTQRVALDEIGYFDTETDTYTKLDVTLSATASSVIAEAKGTDIYVLTSNNTYKFDTLTNTITNLKVGISLYNQAHAIVGDIIYLFGGEDSSVFRGYIYTFNTLTNTYTKLDVSLGKAISCMSACAIEDIIYIFGGDAERTTSYEQSDVVYMFDTKTNSLNKLNITLPQATQNIGVVVIENYVYLFGGYSNVKVVNTIYKFNPFTETFTLLDSVLPIAISSKVPAIAVGDTVYIISGSNSSRDKTSIEKFVVNTVIPYDELLITSTLNKNVFNIINGDTVQMEMGINNIYIGNTENYGEKLDGYLYKYYEKPRYKDKQFSNTVSVIGSATSTTANIQCNIGDLVIASIVVRDVLIISDDWTLISTSNVNSTDTYGQTLSFAYKFAENTTETITITQASAQRLLVNLIALQGATGFIDNGYSYADSEVASISVNKPEGLVLFACTTPMWNNDNANSYWIYSNNSYLLQAPTNQRLVNSLDQSNDTEVTFSKSMSTGTTICGSLTILGIDKFYDIVTEEWASIYEA